MQCRWLCLIFGGVVASLYLGAHATGDDSGELSGTKGDGDELSLAIEKLGSEACIKYSVNARVCPPWGRCRIPLDTFISDSHRRDASRV